MVGKNNKNLGKIIQQQRLMMDLTLKELKEKTGVSESHLGRIEKGERFPSAHILRKIAKPLGFEEDELMTLAGYLSPQSGAEKEREHFTRGLDPYVAQVLAQEPVEVQQAAIGILTILKRIAKSWLRK